MRTMIAAAVLAALTACGGGADDTVDTQGVTSQKVVDAFAFAGLPAMMAEPLADYEARQSGPSFGGIPEYSDDAMHFYVVAPTAREPDPEGGRAFVYDDLGGLHELKDYYDGFGGLLDTWAFANEDCGVLVQINGELPEAKARQYEDVVDGVC